MRILGIVLAGLIGALLGTVAAWFEPFRDLAIVAPLLAGTTAAIAVQVGDRWTRIALLIGGVLGWILGLGIVVGAGRAAGATMPGEITRASIERGTMATIGMAMSVAIGAGVGVYLRTTGAFEPERRRETLAGLGVLAGVIAAMVLLLLAVRACTS